MVLAGWTFESWSRVGYVVLAAVVSYGALVALLRTTGKRTLSTLNAFDLVVTVALGSLLATAVVSRSVALLEGVLALAGVVALQWLVASATVRWPSLRSRITNAPSAVLVDGELQHHVLRRERLRADEVAQAVRSDGHGSLRDVDVVVLESDGSLSVIADAGDLSAMLGVRDLPVGLRAPDDGPDRRRG